MIIMIKRTIDFEYRLTCFYCLTDEIIYQSKWSHVHDERKKIKWPESLTIWADRMRPGIFDFLERAAKQKCKNYGKSGSVCWRYEVRKLRFGEEGIGEKVPKSILEAIIGIEKEAEDPLMIMFKDELLATAMDIRVRWNLVGVDVELYEEGE